MAIEVNTAVRVALRILDDDGLERLTLRRLAAELGVQAPALYWHFDNKRALLDHLADQLVAPVLAGLPARRGRPWWRWLELVGVALHDALLAHRDGARVALGADLRVARSLGELVERVVAVLHRAGLSAADASRAAGVFVHFVLGRAVEDQTRPDPETEAAIVAGLPFPVLARGMRERQQAGATAAEDFRYALGVLLAGLRATHDGAAVHGGQPTPG